MLKEHGRQLINQAVSKGREMVMEQGRKIVGAAVSKAGQMVGRAMSQGRQYLKDQAQKLQQQGRQTSTSPLSYLSNRAAGKSQQQQQGKQNYAGRGVLGAAARLHQAGSAAQRIITQSSNLSTKVFFFFAFAFAKIDER
jgi:hypothetical protein